MLRLLTSTLLLAAAGAAWADDATSLAEYLPPETPLYFEVRSPTAAEVERMAVYEALKDPALRELLNRILGEESSFATMNVPLGPAGLKIVNDMTPNSFSVKAHYLDSRGERTLRLDQRFALAWVGMVRKPFPVDLVGAMQVEGDPVEAVRTLERIVAAASLALREEREGDVDSEIAAIFTAGSHNGVAYRTAQMGVVQLTLAPVGGLVVLATSKERVHDMLDRHADPDRASLAGDPRFLEMHRRADGSGTPMTTIAFQVDHALNALQAHFPEVVASIRAGMMQVGLGGLRSLTTVARVDGRGVRSTSAVIVEGRRTGLSRLFAGGEPASGACLEFAPRSTIYAMSGSFEPAALWNIGLEVGGLMVAMAGSQFEKKFGLRLREDLLELIGPEAAFIVASNRGLLPDVALVVESKDAGRLEGALLRILDSIELPAGVGVQRFRIGDSPVHTLPLGHPKLGGVPLAPTLGVVDGHLLVTLFPMSFQRIAAVKRGEKPSLAANRDFAALRERVPEEALGLSYLDLGRVFEIFYETGVPLLQAMPPAPATAPPHYELPDVEVFSRHLFGRIAWRTADENGMYWHSYSSMDTSGLLLGLVGAGAAMFTMIAEPVEIEGEVVVLEESGERPGEQAKKSVTVGLGVGNREARLCRDRVRLLRARIHLYMRERGKLPGSLEELEAEHVQAETFLVPGTDKPYVYLGPEGRGGVLLHGHPNGADERICVLTTELVIQRLTSEQLEALLASEPEPADR